MRAVTDARNPGRLTSSRRLLNVVVWSEHGGARSWRRVTMSGSYELANRAEGFGSLVGWNARLETFFLIVYRHERSSENIGPAEMLFGTSPRELPTIECLDRACFMHGQISPCVRDALGADQTACGPFDSRSLESSARTFEEGLLCLQAEDLARGRRHLTLVHDLPTEGEALDAFHVRVAQRLRGCWYRIASGPRWHTLTIDGDGQTAIIGDLVRLIAPISQPDWRMYETNRPNDARFPRAIGHDPHGWR